MTFEVTFDDAEAAIVENYLQRADMNISQAARRAILEMIFDDDAVLSAYEKAMSNYKKDPTTYTHEEVLKTLDMA